MIVGKKYDIGKPKWHLLPWVVMTDVVKILTFGSEKYGDFNWQHVEPFRERYFDAAIRHTTQWYSGEVYDEETKMHHLAHAICNLMFLIWKDKQND